MTKITKEECEKACLYLLGHCYEEKKNEDGTYEFTPSGFVESEIFKKLINEHFDNPPLKFDDLKECLQVWDSKYKLYRLIDTPYDYYDIVLISNSPNYKYESIEFEENRFYRYEVKEDAFR